MVVAIWLGAGVIVAGGLRLGCWCLVAVVPNSHRHTKIQKKNAYILYTGHGKLNKALPSFGRSLVSVGVQDNIQVRTRTFKYNRSMV